MSRVWGILALAVGVFVLTLGIALPVVGEPRLFKIPLDQASTTVAEARGATYFSPKDLAERRGVDLVATRRVIPFIDEENPDNPASSNEDQVVMNVSLVLEDPSIDTPNPENRVVNATIDHLALDRRSSEARQIDGESFDGDPVRHKGLTYKFPFHTEKKTYTYWDNTAKNSYPIRYLGTEKIKGLDAYKFQMTVDPVQTMIMDFPGQLLGGEAVPVKAPRFYANTRTLWVEPTTGLIVRGKEEQRHTLRNEVGEDKVTLLEADLEWNDKTITQQSDRAKDALSSYRAVVVTVPIAAVTLGLLLILGGVLVLRRNRRTTAGSRAEQDDRAPSHV